MKFNIDNLFRTKLSEIKYDFKPEYWKEMEQMLDKEGGAGASGSGFFSSSIFFKAAIVFTFAVLIGILSYIYFGNKKQDTPPSTKIEISKDATIIPKNIDTVNEELNDINEIDPCLEETESVQPSKKREEIHLDYFRVSPTIVEYIGAKLDKELDIKILRQLKPYVIEDDPLQLSDEIIYPEKTESPDEDIIAPKHTIKKPDVPKNIKPMDKPVKHVFKKRKGILWYLGFRK